jgi:hypothetical protein
VILFASGVVALLVGCQMIVPGEIPEYRCTGADPSACPSGMTCDSVTERCVAAISDTGDGGTAPVDAHDATPNREAAAPAASIGDNCLTDDDCKDGLLCGTSTILTTAIVSTSSKPVCTKPCCTSADCPPSFVCFSPGTGGNYCVAAKLAQRSPTGSKTPGTACVDSVECRSGLCANGHCLDSCCSVADCAGGTTCRVETVTVPPPAHETWSCAIPDAAATTQVGGSCSGPVPRCVNNNCSSYPLRCRPPCCNSAQCVAMGNGFAICAYGKATAGNSDMKWCLDSTASGDAGLGEACSGDPDCASRMCDLETKTCATVCCEDTDCPADRVCRPSPVGAPLLRCIPGRRSSAFP